MMERERLDDEMYRPLIAPEDIGRLARPCEAERTLAERCIEEAVLKDVRPKIGSGLYLRLIHGVEYGLLLDGGEYTVPCPGGRAERRSLRGLRTAVAYYAYARILRTGGLNVTRFGIVKKTDEYSTKIEAKEVSIAVDDAVEIADLYMQECLVYMHDNPDLFPDYHGGERMRSDRGRTLVLGD